MTQRHRVGNCIKNAGGWINKIKIREMTGAEQPATRVWELINLENWVIESRKSEINDCEDYKFISDGKIHKVEIKPKMRIEAYRDEQGYEHIREVPDFPVQQNFI